MQTIFERMAVIEYKTIVTEQKTVRSTYLGRDVIIDIYLPMDLQNPTLSLLLINDGQDLVKMNFVSMLDGLIATGQITPIVCVGIHAGERLSEFGTAHIGDYKHRGEKAFSYQQFLLEELLPLVHITYGIDNIKTKALAGFSLGGLMAFDTIWNNKNVFSIAGIFSGSLWWRTKSLRDGYNETTDRIIHQKVRDGAYHPGLRFYFTTGSLDETADRNNNGIIDSIDDTVSLMEELKNLGYKIDKEIRYRNYEDGRHDVETWGKAMPGFLLWGWGIK